MTRQSSLRQGVHAIVPVKVLSKSKIRLSPILDSKGRADLTVAILKDVLFALSNARRVESITIVSADKKLRRVADQFRSEFIWEGRRRGLNRALMLAIKQAVKTGKSAILVIHADLPFVTGREVDEFLVQSSRYEVAFNPSKDEDGTNALFLQSSEMMKPAFGKNSYENYVALARTKGLRYKVVKLDRIGSDIDEPRDFLQLMSHHGGRNTGLFLQNWIGKVDSSR